jgi:hypothetical protein
VALAAGSAARPADEPDPEVKRLMRTVADSANPPATRVAAARKIGALGEEKGLPAARALCQAATAPGQVRTAALEALEKVHPRLYPHVVTLIADNDSNHHYQALGAIAKMGEEAGPAVPVLQAHLKFVTSLVGRLEDYDDSLLVMNPADTMAIPLVVELARLDEDAAIRSVFYRYKRARTSVLYKQEKASILTAANAIAMGRIAGREPTAAKVVADTLLPHSNNLVRYAGLVSLSLFDPPAAVGTQKAVKRLKTDSDKAVRELAAEVDRKLEEVPKKK